MASGTHSGGSRDGGGTKIEVDVETARMWRRAPRPFVLFVTLFFAVWTVRATVLYGIDTHIAPDLTRRLYDYTLKVTLWVVPVIVYLCRVERVPPWRALRLTTAVSRSGLAKAGTAAALYFGVVLLYATARGRDLSAFLHAKLPLALASVAFSPVCEEIVFRGFILGRLWAALGFWRANLITALLFTLVHWPNWLWVHGWPFALTSSVSVYVVGVFLGMLVKLTDFLVAQHRRPHRLQLPQHCARPVLAHDGQYGARARPVCRGHQSLHQDGVGYSRSTVEAGGTTMASETQIQQRPLPPVDAWPPDDTEESILGTDLHQTTITNLRWGINEAARLNREPGQPVPWKALSQIALLGCVRPDGSAYRTYPDVFVYPRFIEPDRGALTLAVDGPPVLLIEVLSESTYEVDVDLVRGKGYSYARAGVREYLALDPTGAFLPGHGHAWRLVDGVYRSWEPDATGRWQSAEIGVAIGLEGTLATVYTQEGKRLLHEGEVEEELARRDETITRQAAEIEELRRQLWELRGKH